MIEIAADANEPATNARARPLLALTRLAIMVVTVMLRTESDKRRNRFPHVRLACVAGKQKHRAMITSNRYFTRYTASPHLSRNAILTCSEHSGTSALVNTDNPQCLKQPHPIRNRTRINLTRRPIPIAACGGDAREAVKALLVANEFLERDEAQVSHG
jgi:hypothetical protein